MSNNFFKVVIYSPTNSLFEFLNKNVRYHNIELFKIGSAKELEQYILRMQPNLAVIHLDANPEKYQAALRSIQKFLSFEKLWVLLIIDEKLSIEKLRATLPVNRIIIQKDNDDYQQIAHNLLSIKNIDKNISQQISQNNFEKNINHCLKIIYQEKTINRVFEQLVNYFPKVIMMDYWALFAVDKQMRRIEYFSQFIPPTLRQQTQVTHNLDHIVGNWIEDNRPFLLSKSDDPKLFDKINKWGWPVIQIYFLPITIQERAIGGLIVGNGIIRQLAAKDIRFLNEIVQFMSKRILDENLTKSEEGEISDFSDQIIADRADEDTIIKHTCKKLTEVTHATSAIYWKYNKGFGFLFPKHFSSVEWSSGVQPQKKDVIFFNKESFLRQFINQGKVQALDNILENKRLAPTTKDVFQKLQYCHILILPIKVKDEITGALIINKKGSNERFDILQTHKSEEILKRTQKVIEDIQTVKEANLKLKQLSRIFELGNEFKLNLNLNEILSRIAQSLRKTLGWNDIVIVLKDELGKTYCKSTILGFKVKTNIYFDFNKDLPTEQLDGFLEKCEKISNSYFFNSQVAKPGVNGGNVAKTRVAKWQKNDLLIVPMETRNKLLGFLIVNDPVDILKPTPEKISPLEYYANQAAVAVDNSLLYEQLRASQERYRTLTETMSLALVRCNVDGNIVYLNPAVEDLFGYSDEELLGKDLLTFFTKNSQEPLQDMYKKLLGENSKDQKALENLEFDILSESGEAIPVSVFGFPFFESRKQTGFFLILNDLRVIKRLERMKADFNSMIVHDLRSPMNVIQGFIELIRNGVVGEVNSEQQELLDIAKENVKKVLALVDNFLLASKLEVGKFEIDSKLGEINLVIEKQVANHSVLTKSKNINIKVQLDQDIPFLYFDSTRIDQVLNNLLSNATKFTPENGDIFVKSKLVKCDKEEIEKMQVQILVQDTGIGIPKDKLVDIFEKYEQVDSNEAFNVRGTGLGLSICKEIVNQHGGEIWVESNSDTGSTFIFTLPIDASMEKIAN